MPQRVDVKRMEVVGEQERERTRSERRHPLPFFIYTCIRACVLLYHYIRQTHSVSSNNTLDPSSAFPFILLLLLIPAPTPALSPANFDRYEHLHALTALNTMNVRGDVQNCETCTHDLAAAAGGQ